MSYKSRNQARTARAHEILGYTVIGYKEGHIEDLIVDLLALKDRLDVADALLDHVCEFFDGIGIKTVFYQVVEGHPYQMLSKRKGFIDSRSRPNIARARRRLKDNVYSDC